MPSLFRTLSAAALAALVTIGPAAQAADPERVLIAYFTWADNTVVEHPEQVDVDAVSAASLLAPGNTALLASWIQERVGGDLYSITVKDPYSSDYDECLDRAADERDHGMIPELNPGPADFASYDVIFLGYPNWWYSLPMAVEGFLQEHDFTGKKVIPFCAHGTGGLARSLIDLERLLPEGTEVAKAFGVSRQQVKSSRPALEKWLEELGY